MKRRWTLRGCTKPWLGTSSCQSFGVRRQRDAPQLRAGMQQDMASGRGDRAARQQVGQAQQSTGKDRQQDLAAAAELSVAEVMDPDHRGTGPNRQGPRTGRPRRRRCPSQQVKGLPCGQDGQGRKQQALSGAIQQSLPYKRAGQAGATAASWDTKPPAVGTSLDRSGGEPATDQCPYQPPTPVVRDERGGVGAAPGQVPVGQ